MLRAAVLSARFAGAASRKLGRGGGTSLPGKVLLRIRPNAVAELAAGLPDGTIVVSATNGKTTTTRMIDTIAAAAGTSTITNAAGANLLRGVATALLERDADDELGLFEVDEAALAAVVEQMQPRTLVLMNLFRDQLDRFGELESLLDRWRVMLAKLTPDCCLVLNADDPAVAYLGDGRTNVRYFGIEDPSLNREHRAHAADSTHCPRCDARLDYSLTTIGHQGHWSCPSCGLARPNPHVGATHVRLDGLSGSELTIGTHTDAADGTELRVELGVAGVHNVYNALAAVGAAQTIGIDRADIITGLSRTTAAFGRGERVGIGRQHVEILLAKNPAGANENIRTVLLDPEPLHLFVLLNDRTADGQDVSWIWDVDYEPLFERLGSITVSGTRPHELALRLVYGGLDPTLVHVESDPARALDHALNTAPDRGTIYALPTYTAMLDLRDELVRRGLATAFWDTP